MQPVAAWEEPPLSMATLDFEELANRHKDAVYRQMLRACGNHADAEDVLVEALFKAYRKLGTLERSEAFQAWLARIASRVCLRLKQRQTLAPLMQLSALEEKGQELANKEEALDETLARSQMKAVLLEAIGSLPEHYRQVYELRDVEELPGEEVAARLGLSLTAMKSRLHRARTMLRERLDEAILNGKAVGRNETGGNGQCWKSM